MHHACTVHVHTHCSADKARTCQILLQQSLKKLGHQNEPQCCGIPACSQVVLPGFGEPCLASQNMVVPFADSDEVHRHSGKPQAILSGSPLRSIRPCRCLLHAAMTVRDEACTLRLRASARPNHDLVRRQPDRARHLITQRGTVG